MIIIITYDENTKTAQKENTNLKVSNKQLRIEGHAIKKNLNIF